MILDIGCDEIDHATLRRLDGSLVDEPGCSDLIGEFEAARKKVRVGQSKSGNRETGDIDNSTTTDEHAVGIKQKNPAIGKQLAQDVGSPPRR